MRRRVRRPGRRCRGSRRHAARRCARAERCPLPPRFRDPAEPHRRLTERTIVAKKKAAGAGAPAAFCCL